jgi:nitroimidazol reductase NimA-like FMN-containing flavoprotein (pyridoxamine 5'-phosphate oxidase superfamily)
VAAITSHGVEDGAQPKLTQAEVEEFLAGPRICRLGCVDSDSFPLVVPCNYVFEGGGQSKANETSASVFSK